MALAMDHDFTLRLAYGTLLRGWTVAVQGQMPEGLQQIRQGQHAYHATGAEYEHPYLLALQAEIYGNGGHLSEALQTLAEALTVVEHTGERRWEAELHRLQGECLLARQDTRQPSAGTWLQGEEAEAVFPTGTDHCPWPAGEVVRTTCRHEPQSAVAAARQAGSSPSSVGRGVCMVHRGV